MRIIVGLGNPGGTYAHSRHNTGWRVVDKLAMSVQLEAPSSWRLQKPLDAEILEIDNRLFVKPQTFMNASGKAVRAVMKKYAYAALARDDFSELFVVYDDLDMPLGKSKIVFGSGPKVHNGVNSVEEELGTDQFWHVRVGVDGRNGDRSQDPADYVLGGFSEQEQRTMEEEIQAVVKQLYDKTA